METVPEPLNSKPNRFKGIFLILIIETLLIFAAKIAVMIGGSAKVVEYVSMLASIMVISGTIVFPFVYVLTTAKYLKGVFFFWFIGWTSLVSVSMILRSVLIDTRPELRDVIIDYLPEELIVLPMFMFGWMNALLLCGIAYGLRSLFIYVKHKRTEREDETGAGALFD